jgi:hypothetical protein
MNGGEPLAPLVRPKGCCRAVNPANPANAESTIRDVGAAVRAMGSQIQVLNVGGSREIDAAFASLARGPVPLP